MAIYGPGMRAWLGAHRRKIVVRTIFLAIAAVTLRVLPPEDRPFIVELLSEWSESVEEALHNVDLGAVVSRYRLERTCRYDLGKHQVVCGDEAAAHAPPPAAPSPNPLCTEPYLGGPPRCHFDPISQETVCQPPVAGFPVDCRPADLDNALRQGETAAPPDTVSGYVSPWSAALRTLGFIWSQNVLTTALLIVSAILALLFSAIGILLIDFVLNERWKLKFPVAPLFFIAILLLPLTTPTIASVLLIALLSLNWILTKALGLAVAAWGTIRVPYTVWERANKLHELHHMWASRGGPPHSSSAGPGT